MDEMLNEVWLVCWTEYGAPDFGVVEAYASKELAEVACDVWSRVSDQHYIVMPCPIRKDVTHIPKGDSNDRYSY
jgi:hypothetical protein